MVIWRYCSATARTGQGYSYSTGFQTFSLGALQKVATRTIRLSVALYILVSNRLERAPGAGVLIYESYEYRSPIPVFLGLATLPWDL